MTTRRGFIQGVLVAIGAAVLPKVAEAEAPSVNHRMLHAIDELMAAEEACFDDVKTFPYVLSDDDMDFIRGTEGESRGYIGPDGPIDFDRGDWFGGILAKWTEEATDQPI